MMASYYTRSKAPSEYSHVEPSDVAPLAATSTLPPSIFAGLSVVAVG